MGTHRAGLVDGGLGRRGKGSGGGVQGRSKFRNVCRIFVVSNVQKEEKWLFLKDALWHRSWPGGRGSRPSALIPGTKRRKMAFFEGCPVGWWGVPTGAGLVDGGVLDAWRGKAGWSWLGEGGVREAEQGLGGGCKGFGSGGVSGRGTGPRDGANFATGVVFCRF